MYTHIQVAASIKYLEFCVNVLENPSRAIHNFLISAYVQSSSEHSLTKLIDYLVKQSKVSPMTSPMTIVPLYESLCIADVV